MDKLEEAKLRYPIGTKFKSAYSHKLGTVTGTPILQDGGDIYVPIDNDSFYVYYKEEWAEVVLSPLQIVNEYQIY